MKLYLFFLAFLAMSCTAPAPTNAPEPESSPEETVSTEVDFPTFLTEFARVLATSENQTLNRMVAEELEVWGREDQDPKLRLTEIDRIIKVLEVYDRGGVYDSETDHSISYKELFENEELLEKSIQSSGDDKRVEDFVFSKDKTGQWKLTQVYWDTKNQR